MGTIIKKLPGTTLVETLVSVTIISVVSALAMIIFWQVSGPASSTHFLQLAQQKSAEIIGEVEQIGLSEVVISERNFKYEGLNFISSVTRIEDDLKRLEVEVFDNAGRKVYSVKRLFYAPPDIR